MAWSRRRLLRGLAAGALFAPFAHAGPQDELQAVSAAFRRAVDRGVHLVVLVIPEDDGEKWSRGELLAELLTLGSEELLDQLAATELVAATMADLRALVPSAPRGEPLLVVVDTAVIPAGTKAVFSPLAAPDATLKSPWEEDWAAQQRAFDERQRDRVAQLERTVRHQLPERTGDGRALRAQLSSTAPVGARWYVRGGGCAGGHLLGEEPAAVDCGMGHVPMGVSMVLYLFE
ncbi:MAG: hypothetical protein EP330_18570 [Deltaproteobacteria bacterium]|nr:MAG: hypothetical protein EP330_18570 [Deltaproteobacteria bacterium]